MKQIIQLSLVVTTALFIGCGGGGSSSSSGASTQTTGGSASSQTSTVQTNETNSSAGKTDDKNNTSTTEETVDTTKDENTSTSTTTSSTDLKNSSYVAGIYDVTGDGDEKTYLSIANDGLITTYLYQSTCYQKNPDSINKALNGTKLINDETNKSFTSQGYSWIYGNTTQIQRVALGGISAGTILSLNDIKIATSKALTTEVTTADLEDNLCK